LRFFLTTDGLVEPAPWAPGPADGAPVDEGPVDEAPVDEGPVDEGPVDEGPADGGPARPGPDPALPRMVIPQRPHGDGDSRSMTVGSCAPASECAGLSLKPHDHSQFRGQCRGNLMTHVVGYTAD
jgi:hypothetical protein